MPWYLRSYQDGDTHRGVLTNGEVHAECGTALRPSYRPMVAVDDNPTFPAGPSRPAGPATPHCSR